MEINSARLYLRKTTINDIPIFLKLDGQKEVMRYIGKGTIRTNPEHYKAAIPRIIRQYEEGNGFGLWWAIEKESQQEIGWFILKPLPDGKEIEIGYRLFPECWGKGYATEMTKSLIEYGVKDLGLKKIVAVTHPENIASQKVLLKSGLKAIGKTKYLDFEVDKFEFTTG